MRLQCTGISFPGRRNKSAESSGRSFPQYPSPEPALRVGQAAVLTLLVVPLVMSSGCFVVPAFVDGSYYWLCGGLNASTDGPLEI